MTGAAWTSVATALAAVWATGWNAWAAYEAPRPWSRVYLITSAFSVCWSVAYGWLAIFPEANRSEWSEAITPMALASFLFVWSAPAMISSVLRYRARKKTERSADGE